MCIWTDARVSTTYKLNSSNRSKRPLEFLPYNVEGEAAKLDDPTFKKLH